MKAVERVLCNTFYIMVASQFGGGTYAHSDEEEDNIIRLTKRSKHKH